MIRKMLSGGSPFERLREEISDFQRFLIHDLWILSKVTG